ncbi:MAG: hypothetical protein H0V17_23045 [Deltaproteobacteria bacterium]|nr:hypothetical protein [Deltaproteobacteria bacterium]
MTAARAVLERTRSSIARGRAEDLRLARTMFVAALVAAPSFAGADTPRDAPTEIEVDRADAPAGRTELGFDGGAPVDGWGVTLSGGWLEGPVVFGLPDGTTSEPVRRRETAMFGGALALGESVVVDGRWSFAHQIGDRLRGTGDERALDERVPGDLRFGVRLRVMARTGGGVFVRGDLALPTGDHGDFAGDAGASLAWRLIGRANLPHRIVFAASAGLRLRGQEILVADRLVGNEALVAAGIAIPLPPLRPLWCVDQVKLTVDASAAIGDKVGAGRGPSPAEVRFGVVTQPRPAWTFGVRVGTGITDEIGSPALRATIEVTYRGDWKLLAISRDSVDGDSDE